MHNNDQHPYKCINKEMPLLATYLFTSVREGGSLNATKILENRPVHDKVKEIESYDEYLEVAKKVGKYYVNFINSLAGNLSVGEQGLEKLPQNVQKIFRAMQKNTQKLQEIYDLRRETLQIGARELLAQVIPFEQTNLLNQESSYRLEKLNKGIYGVMIKPAMFMFENLFPRRGAQAMAAKVRKENGISFVLIPEYEDSEKTEAHRRENLPHEINHLIWSFMEKGGDIFTDEQNDELRRGFLLYREELLCRLSTGRIVGGYDHVRAESANRKRLEAENPTDLQALDEVHGQLYDLCQDIQTLLPTSEEVRNGK